MKLSFADLKDFLDEKVNKYNCPFFIESDPISIPHSFIKKEDREISGFLTALLAWGQRPVILRNARNLMERMELQPHQFILNHSAAERRSFQHFVHRTFNGMDLMYLLKTLQKVYQNENGLEGLFTNAYQEHKEIGRSISSVRNKLLSYHPPARTAKHLADPLNNSSAKRVNMFLRWMVRKDQCGVDFGIWSQIPSSALYCPLDVHSGRIARSFHLLKRRQDDWKAVIELTQSLRNLDAHDPVKYDYALFGLGAMEGFR